LNTIAPCTQTQCVAGYLSIITNIQNQGALRKLLDDIKALSC
jgi:hypothetical protein